MRTNAKFIYLCCMLALLDALSLSARILYISPSGNDGGSGEINAPWKTLAKAGRSAQAADTVYIRAGTYKEMLTPANSGRFGAQILFAAYPGDSVILDAKGLSNRGIVTISAVKHVRVTGLTLINGSTGIWIINSSYITVDRNHTYDTYSSGIIVSEGGINDHVFIRNNDVELACNDGAQECISVSKCDTFEIIGNHIHHGGPGSRGGEGIDCKFGSRNGIVAYNYVHHLSRQGLYADAWTLPTSDIVFYGNIVHDCDFGIGAASEQGGTLDRIMFHNNLVYNCDGPGMYILRSASTLRKLYFINNTIHHCGYGWGRGMWMNGELAEGVVIRNNIFSGMDTATFSIARAPASITVDHNLSNLTEKRYATGFIKGVPLYSNADSGDFHLLHASVGIDAGNDSTLYPLSLGDLDGRPRIADGNGDGLAQIDLGAFEYSKTGIHIHLSNGRFRQSRYRESAIRHGELAVTTSAAASIFDLRGRRFVIHHITAASKMPQSQLLIGGDWDSHNARIFRVTALQ